MEFKYVFRKSSSFWSTRFTLALSLNETREIYIRISNATSMNLIVRLLLGFAFAITAPLTALADFDMTIGGGYGYVHCNSMDTVITKAYSSTVIFSPRDYAGVGPIKAYSSTQSYIFLRTTGRKNRSLFDGDTFENVDNAKTFYFVIDKADDSTAGPLTKTEFDGSDAVINAGQIAWQTPRHPMLKYIFAIFLLLLVFAVVGAVWLTMRFTSHSTQAQNAD